MTAVCAPVVTRWWHAVDRCDVWQAVCAACRWEAAIRTNPHRARVDADEHTKRGAA